MSLINEMLKDLEKRKNIGQYTASIPIMNTIQSNNFRFNFKIVFTLMIATLLCTSSYVAKLFLNSHQQSNTPLIQSNQSQMIEPTRITKTAADNVLSAVNITGVTVHTKENITELTLMLNHPALYEVTTNGMQNQVSITVEKAQLQSEIPLTHFVNNAIQSITTNQVNGDLRFNLTLNSNASLKYLNMNSDASNPELVIAIETSTGEHAVKSSNVKTPAMQSLLIQKYEAAVSDAKLGKLQQAVANLSELIEEDPSYQEARATLAALLFDKGNLPQASKIVDESLNLFPGTPAFVELKARLLTHDGKTQQALNILQSALPPISDNPDYHALVAALYQRTNKDTLAINTYQKLLSLNLHNGSWWFGLAVSYDKIGKSKEAINAYEHAIAEGHLNSASLTYLQSRLESLQESENDKV